MTNHINKYEVTDDRLTAIELGHLWNSYMIESLVHHILSYFIIHVNDPLVRSNLDKWFNDIRESLFELEKIFKQEKIAAPRGITSEDIMSDAPRLFSDSFYIIYIKGMAKFALRSYTIAYIESTRPDIRNFFKHYIERLVLIDQQAIDLMIIKGFYENPPYIPVPQEVDFIQKQNFLTGFFGHKRELTAIEITHLFTNAQLNALGKTLLTGFAQVTQSKEIQQFFLRGKSISNKYIHIFNETLLNEDIKIASSLDGEITDSTEPPFSDKLMLFHITLLSAAGLADLGNAMATSQRRDLATMYARILPEVGTYAEDGSNLLIKYGWMEQPPTAPDRNNLSNQNKTT